MSSVRICAAMLICFIVVSPELPAAPQQEGAEITRLAPEKCDLCIAWSATIRPDANGSSLERWLAQPEIQEGYLTLNDLIESTTEDSDGKQSAEGRIVMQLTKIGLDHPWIFYIDELEFEKPNVKFVLQLGDQEDQVRKLLQEVENSYSGDAKKVTINGMEFSRLPSSRNSTSMELGVFEGHFVLAVGEGELEKLLNRFNAATPQWVTDVRDELPIERLAGIFRMDLAKVIRTADEEGDIPPELHLEEIQDLIGTIGLQDGETVTRLALHCPKNLQGILQTFEMSAIPLNDLAAVPDSVNALFAAKFAPQTVWNILKSNEDSKSDIAEFVQMMQSDYGIDFEEDVIDSFGEFMYSYQELSLVNPAASGIVSIRIKNPERFAVRLPEIAARIEEKNEDIFIDAEETKNGTLYKVVPADGALGMGLPTPCFSLVDNQLLFALDAKAISSHLRKSNRKSGRLIDDERFTAFFDDAKNGGLGQPIGVHFLDHKTLIETVYSVVPMMLQGPLANADFDFADLPPLEVITNGIRSDIVGIYRTERGFQMLERTTLPGMTTMTPFAIGLSLPAVQQTRAAARRVQSMNNVKQLNLALLNFESAYMAFPSAYTQNEENKKLLSWRVHVLPWLDEALLYERFHLDEPWDSPHNKALIAEMPEVFKHPSLDLEPGETVYLGVTGKDAILVAPSEAGKNGKMTMGTTLGQVTDGSSNTLLVVEANEDHAVTWTQPEDFDMDEIEDLIGALKGNWPGENIIIGFCDGSTQIIRPSSNEELKKMMTKSGGEVIDE